MSTKVDLAPGTGVTDEEASMYVGGRTARDRIKLVLNYAFMTLLAGFFVGPIVYLFVGSLKPSQEVLNGLAGFLPVDVSLDNYAGVIERFSNEATGYFSGFYVTSRSWPA
jgi:multiple sugar transport system permease protein